MTFEFELLRRPADESILPCGQINTQAPAEITDCSNPLNSKYYVVVIQVRSRTCDLTLRPPRIKCRQTYCFALDRAMT